MRISYILLGIGTLFLSCEKDKAEQLPDVVYTVNIEGYKVTFDNQTLNGQSYKWEFGDGATSTEKSPVHIYAKKGKFVPTLYVTTANGKVIEGSTVLRISKGTAVKLNDNSFSDWDTVTHNVVMPGAGSGNLKKAKYDYDGNYVYFYFEVSSTKANGDIFDFYMDTDNSAATGYNTWLFTGAGNDVLLEGALLTGWFDVFYHKGDPAAFAFDYQSISDFFEIGTISESGGILTFEGRLTRSKIKGLLGTGFKIGVATTKNDWSAMLGALPTPAAASFFIDMSE
ncbi:PKD domain-containing protein [Chitinophaga sp. SYP-B3965]|uniref:PKD domain-containing protein n=1 Tax=Chitinophaga sp. SYP-B3965 TaxID=2663120 RepID=UPI001299A6EA|nr:PKD domain-containing protein [Chitinophaga sp. SYP-B3965]MRG47287.1 PKD domain-containing protein [Chitinophaga sp. SYP-B3965]